MTQILVVGAGSSGARHARHLADAGADVAVMDPDAARAASVECAKSVPYSLDDLGGYDGIVIASPTSSHRAQTEAALESDAKILVEKPIALLDEPVDAIVACSERVMVGYNLRFHDPLVRFIEEVEAGAAGPIHAVRVWFGSWLPDWRPTVDYRTTYSARADLGGGVLLDAIHELDVLVWLLGDGDFAVAGSFVGRVGPLELDTEDTVKAVLVHRTGVTAEVSLDYLSRRYRRGVEVVGERATARLDWARAVREIEDGDSVRTEDASTPVAQSYQREAEHFLAFVRGERAPVVDARAGAQSLELARRIRAAHR